MSLETWAFFLVLWAGLVALPGANAAFIMASAMANGLPRAFLGPVGIALTVPPHTLISALGLSAILAASAELFTVVKWAGVVYLAWIGLRQLRQARSSSGTDAKPAQSARQILAQGFLVSMFNPKTVMVYVAIYPHFIVLDRPLVPQLAVLMATQVAAALLIYSAYAVLAGQLHRWLLRRGRGRVMGQLSGAVYLEGASALAIAKRNAS
jgi:homoserine/homoserine lactone efflux protein